MELILRKAEEKDLDGLDQVMLVISDAPGSGQGTAIAGAHHRRPPEVLAGGRGQGHRHHLRQLVRRGV